MATLQSHPSSKQPPYRLRFALSSRRSTASSLALGQRSIVGDKTMGRYRRTSPPPLAAVALLFLICVFHYGAAARPLPAVPLVHHENGVKDAADGTELQEGAAGNGDELSMSEVMGETEEVEAVCEEGNDECMQRRLLRDAHLDYIYTQHKGKP